MPDHLDPLEVARIVDRFTVYDTAYLSARNRRLRDQGWEVIM